MKTSMVSILLGICLTGVQAELPYNMPGWRRDNSPPIIPDPEYHYTKTHTRTHTGHHGTGTGHHGGYPTGYPHHHNPPRDAPHSTFITVTGTGGGYPHHTGTGGSAHPTHHPIHPQPGCQNHNQCRSLVCPQVMPPKQPQCVQGREGKYCACTVARTD